MSWPIVVEKGSPKHRLWQVVGYGLVVAMILWIAFRMRELPDPELRERRRGQRRDPRADAHHRVQRPDLDRPELLLRTRRLRHCVPGRQPRLELPPDLASVGRTGLRHRVHRRHPRVAHPRPLLGARDARARRGVPRDGEVPGPARHHRRCERQARGRHHLEEPGLDARQLVEPGLAVPCARARSARSCSCSPRT